MTQKYKKFFYKKFTIYKLISFFISDFDETGYPISTLVNVRIY